LVAALEWLGQHTKEKEKESANVPARSGGGRFHACYEKGGQINVEVAQTNERNAFQPRPSASPGRRDQRTYIELEWEKETEEDKDSGLMLMAIYLGDAALTAE
jgi:hypothetical protein